MNLLTQIERIRYVDYLIRIMATGTPKQLASKLDVSKATVYRIIALLKDMGVPIVYCRQNESYRYTDETFSIKP